MSRHYTGIGSRDVSEEEYDILKDLAEVLAKRRYVLRSGGAQGADTAFEEGCSVIQGRADIYIPWGGFGKKIENPNSVRYKPQHPRFQEARQYLIDSNIISWFDNMKQGAQKLHARNYYQVKGVGVLSEFLVYCADDTNGTPKGGTRTAVLLARSFGIPTYNIRDKGQLEELMLFIERL